MLEEALVAEEEAPLSVLGEEHHIGNVLEEAVEFAAQTEVVELGCE